MVTELAGFQQYVSRDRIWKHFIDIANRVIVLLQVEFVLQDLHGLRSDLLP